MVDPLSILRQYHISKKPILEKNDRIVLGENSWPKSAKTNYLICGSGKKGSAKDYYTLESLLFFLRNMRLPHSVYNQNAVAANIPAVKHPDRKELLLYLTGINASSTSIDKKACTENPSTVKSEEQNQSENKKQNTKLKNEDNEETKQAFEQFLVASAPVTELMKKLTKKVRNEEQKTQKGLSFLDLKIMIYSNYLTNLSYYIYKKASGEKIENDPVVERLVELRVVMEKMKPIEEKLKYQINKMLSNVSSENIDSNDPLKFRANPDNLDTQDDDDNDEAEEGQKESKVYVPPKISAAYYDEDNVLEQKKKVLEKARKKALSSSMLHELRKEYDVGPEEIKEMHDPYKLKISNELKERERFEEEYMMRLPMTKKQRHEMRQLTTVTNFNTKVEDISALEMTPESMQLKKKSNAKKGKFKYQGKKKGSKRKR